jgi:hypothetical protein
MFSVLTPTTQRVSKSLRSHWYQPTEQNASPYSQRAHICHVDAKSKKRAKQNYLTVEDVDAFHSKFMTPRTMAKEYGRSWQSLGAELRSKGVNSFATNGEVYGSLFCGAVSPQNSTNRLI